MVEKWMQNKPSANANLQISPRRVTKVKAQPIGKFICPFKGPKVYYGKSVMLFKDSDKDGVPNVFDCRPFNKKKQDVISPIGGGGISDMYARQEQARQQALYQKQLKQMQQEQEKQVAELQRIQGETRIIDSREYLPTYMVPYTDASGKQTWVNADTKQGQAAIKQSQTGIIVSTKGDKTSYAPGTQLKVTSMGFIVPVSTKPYTVKTASGSTSGKVTSETAPKPTLTSVLKAISKSIIGVGSGESAKSSGGKK